MYYLLPVFSLLPAHCALRIAYCLLLIAYCLLLVAYCLLLVAYVLIVAFELFIAYVSIVACKLLYHIVSIASEPCTSVQYKKPIVSISKLLFYSVQNYLNFSIKFTILKSVCVNRNSYTSSSIRSAISAVQLLCFSIYLSAKALAFLLYSSVLLPASISAATSSAVAHIGPGMSLS